MESRLFFDLAQRCNVGQFVGIDVPAGWQPLAQLAMQQEQRASFMDDKGRRSPITGYGAISHQLLAFSDCFVLANQHSTVSSSPE